MPSLVRRNAMRKEAGMKNMYPMDEHLAEGLLRLLGHASMSMSRHHDGREDEAGPPQADPMMHRLVTHLTRIAHTGSEPGEPGQDRPTPTVKTPAARREATRPKPRRASPDEAPAGGRTDKGGLPLPHPWRCALIAPTPEAEDEVSLATHWLRDLLR